MMHCDWLLGWRLGVEEAWWVGWTGFSHPQVNLALCQPSALCYLQWEMREGWKEKKKKTKQTVIGMQLQNVKKKKEKENLLSNRRQLVKEESTDIFTWEPSIVSLNQVPHKISPNKSMQGVEMNPNLYCVSLVVDLWPWETYSNTCSLAQLLLTEPSLPLSPSPSPSLSLLTSQSVPLCSNLQPPDTLTFTHTLTHTRMHTYSHAHTPPRLSHLVPLAQTAGLTATDKCSWICCCPSLQTGFQQGSVLLPGAPLSSAGHPARSKQGKAKLCGTKGMDGTARDTRRKHAVRWMCHWFKKAWGLAFCICALRGSALTADLVITPQDGCVPGFVSVCPSSCWN